MKSLFIINPILFAQQVRSSFLRIRNLQLHILSVNFPFILNHFFFIVISSELNAYKIMKKKCEVSTLRRTDDQTKTFIYNKPFNLIYVFPDNRDVDLSIDLCYIKWKRFTPVSHYGCILS